ncbi:MAG TPA: 4-aminobutyrate--2-oxoglutarate transaminase [Rhabdaerophilum sp.]|nr:4-aminobutyrate--2-oxoglutarate transaminase [Rhabdaerophilum sp.]
MSSDTRATTNAALAARRAKAVPRGVATAHPVMAARAENSEIWDVEGKHYVDFGGGIAVVNTGHRHPAVMAAVAAQLEKFTHVAFQVTAYEPYIELCEKLNALAPFKEPAKTILFTTGAEATENAVKIARAATGRTGVIAFTGAFHGRTMLTMAMTGKVLPYKRAFGPLPPDVFHVPFPNEAQGVSVEDSLKALDFLFKADIGPDRVAAIIVEPVQGEGGFHPVPKPLFVALREICTRHGILLIADEVQSGFARTGKMFAIEHSRVEPDLVTIAKSMGGGFPISGVIGRADIMDKAEPGGLGGTYAGSPIGCAAALAVLDVIKKEKLLARADMIGGRIKDRLARIAMRNHTVRISDIRGPGAMIACDIVDDDGKPDADAAKRVLQHGLDEGVILLACGTAGNTIRNLVPLTVPDDVLELGLNRMEAAMIKAKGAL